MKAQELRVGNWVSITPFGKNNDIQINEKEFADLIIFKTFHRIEPIPLTEEWLLNFGFVGNYHKHFQVENEHYFIYLTLSDNNEKFIVDLRNYYDYPDNMSDYDSINLPLYCQHVHQLQNIYYSLTGEELCTK